MNKKALLLAATTAGAAFALPTAAQAQDVLPGEGFVGVQAGVHDLDVGDIEDDFAIDLNSGSTIAGVFAGYDMPLGPGAFVGAEANYTFGFGAIDNEYGIAGRLGTRLPGGAKLYARGGYQQVDFDLSEIFDIEDETFFDGVDDSDGDYIVGLGADFPLGGSLMRVNLDTVGFDTVRATAGVGFKF